MATAMASPRRPVREHRLLDELSDEAFDALDRGDAAHVARCLAALNRLAPASAITQRLAGHLAWEQEGPAAALPWLERAVRADPVDPEALYDLGWLHEVLGPREAMIECFLRVRELDIEHDAGRGPIPAVELAFIEHHANTVFGGLPPQFAERLQNVPIILETRPSRDLVADGFDPRALGLFEGVDDRGMGLGEVADRPTRVVLFYANLLATFPDRDALEEQVEVTLLHELGHFFGLDEDQVAKLGLE